MSCKKPKGIYIDKRSNGTERVRIGVKVDGKVICTSTTHYPDPKFTDQQNRKEAIMMGEMLIEKAKSDHYAAMLEKNMTVGEYYETKYVEKVKTYFKKTTAALYCKTFKNIFLPMYGDVELNDITDVMVRDAVETLTREKNIKPQTVKRYITVFRSLINFAVEDGTLSKNPIVGGLRYKKAEPTNVICLDNLDFDKIVRDLQNKVNSRFLNVDRNDVIVAISMLAGTRRGELVALKWKDFINLDEKSLDRVVININDSAIKVAGEEQELDSTKSYSGARMFTVPKILGEVLWDWKQTLIRKNIPVNDDNFVIPNENGEMVSVYSPTRWFKKYLKQHNLKNVKLHSLRHTFASMMLSVGVDLLTLRDLMGHEEVSTTELYLKSFKMKSAHLMNSINGYTASLLSNEEDN